MTLVGVTIGIGEADDMKLRTPTLVAVASLVLLSLGAVAWAWSANGRASPTTVTTTSVPAGSVGSSAPLKAPTTSVANEALFLSDVTEVDPALATYEHKSGNVALRSLITDGSAFCAFLTRDRDIDAAMVSVVVGARQVESQTHLPLSVTTFNTVDSVALLTLCPSLQSMVPVSDQAKISKLRVALALPAN